MTRSDGFVVRGQFVTWDRLKRDFRCRTCGAGFGRPYADPITGELDFDRIVCTNEHEIAQEGDVIRADILDWRKDREMWNGLEVQRNYHIQHEKIDLYGDDGPRGFD